jgi:hypothetical protein
MPQPRSSVGRRQSGAQNVGKPRKARAETSEKRAAAALTLQLLDFVADGRTYGETMEAWQSTCPRMPIWERRALAETKPDRCRKAAQFSRKNFSSGISAGAARMRKIWTVLIAISPGLAMGACSKCEIPDLLLKMCRTGIGASGT